jgi:hypothetical protein
MFHSFAEAQIKLEDTTVREVAGIILDIQNWHTWNTFCPKVTVADADYLDGHVLPKLKVGLEFGLLVNMPNTPPDNLIYSHEITTNIEVNDTKANLRWKSTLLQAVQRTDRYVLLEQRGQDVIMVNGEIFHGLMVPLMDLFSIIDHVTVGFQNMNKDMQKFLAVKHTPDAQTNNLIDEDLVEHVVVIS